MLAWIKDSCLVVSGGMGYTEFLNKITGGLLPREKDPFPISN